MIHIYFAAKPKAWAAYEAPLRAALDMTGIAYDVSATCADPAQVDYLIYAPNGPINNFAPFTRAKAVLSLWAGVESPINNPTLTHPLARMVDSDLTQGMVEWVCGHVLRHHLGMDAQIRQQAPVWRPQLPTLARERKVSILGLGVLGQACAYQLAEFGFDVAGWSRAQKDFRGVSCLAGPDGLRKALSRAEILVLLLPLTQQTENIIGPENLRRLPHGAVILNPGRGALIDDAALLSALDSGQVGHATLDVFRIEPLPVEHPFWQHPRVTVTPHIASETRPQSACRVIVENIRRGEAGAPFMNLADRSAGY